MVFQQQAWHVPWWLLWLFLGVAVVLLVLPLFLRRHRLSLLALQSVVLLVVLLVWGVRNARSSETFTIYVRRPEPPHRIDGAFHAIFMGKGGLALRYHYVASLGRRTREFRPLATPQLSWSRHTGPDHPHYPRPGNPDNSSFYFAQYGFGWAHRIASEIPDEGVVTRAIGVTMPVWAAALPLLVAPGLWLRRGLKRRLRLKRGLCVVCGYDLRASTGRCPECGSGAPATGNASSAEQPA